jgi:hypothetical protein
MARYNEILAGRYNRMLQKLFGMKGGPVAPQLASEIAPAFPLFNGAENRYLEGWQRFGFATSTTTPAAGNRSAWRIRNPAGSNVVAVIEKLEYSLNSVADTPFLFYNAVATVLPTENLSNLTGTQVDVRGGQTGSVSIISTSINFGLIGSGPLWQANAPVNSNIDIILTDIHELPMAPGSQYTIPSQALVNNFLVSVWWRERLLEESERF